MNEWKAEVELDLM